MFYSLRSIALLMLLAGLSLGVFAGTLVANKPPVRTPTLNQKVEVRVNLYRDLYSLDEAKTEAVRQTLRAHQHEVREMLLDLARQHREKFSEQVKETENRIALIVNGS